MPGKGAPNVVLAPQAVVAHLRRCGPRTDEPAGRVGQPCSGHQLAHEQCGLVESTAPCPLWMKRDSDRCGRGQAFHYEPFGEQKRERTGQAPPALVLESMNRILDRTFVRDRGAQAGQ